MKLLDFIKQKACAHLPEYVSYDEKNEPEYKTEMLVRSNSIVIGEWGKKEPHPHPAFKDRCSVNRRPIAVMFYCKTCGKNWIERGYDQRDAEDSLPGLSNPPL